MSRPNILPIRRMDDLHTNLIGRFKGGQFMIIDYYGCDESLLYVVRYLFRTSGEFNHVKHVKLSNDASEDEIQAVKDSFLSELEPHQQCDIRVHPFEVDIDGKIFGLVYSEETQSVDLEPGPLITFAPPWDGEYYT